MIMTEQEILSRFAKSRPHPRTKASLERACCEMDIDAHTAETFKRFAKFCQPAHKRSDTMPVTKTKQSDEALTKAVSQALATDPVAEIHKLNAAKDRSPNAYADLMKQVAARDAAGVEMAKGKSPRVQLAQPSGGDGGGDNGDDLSKKIMALMKERGWGIGKFDLAASEVLRGLGLHGEGYGSPVLGH
jgi:hypothetical protein